MFNIGDVIQAKNGLVGSTYKVILVADSNNTVLVEDTKHRTWALFTNLHHWELVPDPMVARREAVIAYCKALGWTYHQQQFLEGDGDAFVNKIYDAIVATKHLFV